MRGVLHRRGAAHHVGHGLGGRVQNTKQKASTKQKLTIAAIFGAMGPGLLAALSGNDAGGIATYSSAGASYGYKMLWMLPVMTVLLIVTQETAARCGCVTGKGLASLIRERFGVRRSVLAMAALLIANTAVTISEFAGIASGLALFGMPASISVPLVALLVWMLTMSGSFQRIEKILLLVSCVFVTYIVAAFMAGPSWGEVAVDLVVPNIQNDPSYVSLVVATIGTTIAPWMIFLAQNNVVDKNAGEDDIVLQRIDTVSGSIAADVIAGFIIITTGTVLFPAAFRLATLPMPLARWSPSRASGPRCCLPRAWSRRASWPPACCRVLRRVLSARHLAGSAVPIAAGTRPRSTAASLRPSLASLPCWCSCPVSTCSRL